jgi:CubicO group peptidase (beta-lactamase class C family)
MSKAAAGPGADSTARQPSPQQQLDAIFDSVNRGHGPGLVVGVAQHGRTLYRRGFGLASIEHGVALTPRTRMRLASISKHITCLAALLLAEEGKLDLDAPASAVLPELPTLQGMPTLRQFMTHTSGWRCFQELAYIGSGLAWLPAGAGLAMQLAQTEASFAPGTSQLYCNGGYELLSEAIARASGMGFEQFLKDRVFAPLGMVDTESVPSDMAIVPGIATFHQALPDGRWMRGITPLVDNRGAGGVVSTVDDMLRWMAHLRAPVHTVGSEDSWRQMTTPTVLANGSVSPYTLGLNCHDYRGVDVIQHGGSLMGVGSQMVTVPAHGLDVIIMTNGALVNPVQMGWQIIDALLAEHLVGEPAPLAEIDRYRHLVGARYHGPSGMLYGFGEVAGLLGLSILNSPPMPIVRDRGEVLGFRMEEAGMGPLELRRADLAPGPDGGAPAALTVSEAGNAERLRLLPATPPATAQAGRALPGRYRCADLRADASIAFEGEQLVLRIVTPEGRRAAALQAYSDTVFGTAALDPMAPAFHAITLERQGRRITGFRLSSARARRLHFARLPDGKTDIKTSGD